MSQMHDQLVAQVADWLTNAQTAVAFTGAGISTESGIPDFRSPGGVWSKTQPVYFDDFLRSAAARVEYWRQKAAAHADFGSAQPNRGHQVLAKWERTGRIQGVITQNIDGLHQQAGSHTVLELHGTARFVVCLDCQERYETGEMVARFLQAQQPPACSRCGGITKHATVSFGQSLPADILERSLTMSRGADLFLAMGSSLQVQPAASLPLVARESSARVVIINRDATPCDELADVVIHESIGATLGQIDEAMQA